MTLQAPTFPEVPSSSTVWIDEATATADTPDLLEEIQTAQDQLLTSEVDWTLIERNLQLTPVQRLRQHDAHLNTILTLRQLGQTARD